MNTLAVPFIQGSTKIVGIFGDPVTYTLSPQMHNYAFAKLKLNYVYIPFVVHPKQLQQAVESIRSLNLVGVNVTLPHKEAVIPFLDELSPLSEEIGAVNTIVNHHGKLIGHNTDADGFIHSLKEEGSFDPQKKSVLLLGSGGAARAIGVSLIESGVKKITIMNRTIENAKKLVEHLQKIAISKKQLSLIELSVVNFSDKKLSEELISCDLFVNATPSSIDPVRLDPRVFVVDAVYAQATPLILAAKKAGASCMGGIGMLIRQGALSFALWTGEKPPIHLMKEALNHGSR